MEGPWQVLLLRVTGATMSGLDQASRPIVADSVVGIGVAEVGNGVSGPCDDDVASLPQPSGVGPGWP